MMNIFITGATGFIGKNLVKQLINEGNQITINLYNKESSPFDNNVLTYELNENDIYKDISFFNSKKFDGIIHLASLYLKSHKPHEANTLIDSNVRFSTYILQCSAESNVKWFLNTGTFWQCYNSLTYSPVNLYSATKQAFENIAQYFIESESIMFCTLRLSDTYGPGDTRPKIFNFWNKISKTGESLDMSNGEQIIDISFIDDIVSAFILLSKILSQNNSIINNGDVYAVNADKRYTLKELSKIFEKVTGKQLKINWGKLDYRKREVMVPWKNGKSVPGWKPKINLEEGIKRCFFKK